MRNLKKILALALAMIMSLSLMVTASAAKTEFGDQDSINENYQVAIEVLNNLGVLKGDDRDGDGKNEFRPNETITRGEVAAIIYRIFTGKTDVATDGHGIYTAADGEFADVKGHWAEGYMVYSFQGGYIKGWPGVGGVNLNPGGDVTGYEVLTMILRAVGYDKKENEFTGLNWKLNVSTTATTLGVLANYQGTDLGAAATRQEVAEFIFRAILLPKVEYNLVTNSYTQGDPDNTIAAAPLGMKKVTGVVTANEYASLTSDSPRGAGKTDLDGVTYNVSSGRDDLGESRYAYVKGTEVLSSLEDTGDNKTWETSKAYTALGSKAINEAGEAMSLNVTDADRYLNYDGGNTYVSEYKLTWGYWGVATEDDFTSEPDFKTGMKYYESNGEGEFTEVDTENDTYSTVPEDYWVVRETSRNAGVTITYPDYLQIRNVFNYNALYIYVGTKYTQDEDRDKSDTMSRKEFIDEYLTPTVQDYVSVNENGNYVKVIDNNNDGKAEYVLKTTYILDKIAEISKDGVVYFETLDYDVYDGDLRCPDYEPAVGDVVIMTDYIDGYHYVNKAEEFEGVVTDYNRRDDYITVDGTNYYWSGIDFGSPYDGITEANTIPILNLYNDIADANRDTNYIYYLDNYGYVRAFKEADGASYALLTEAYNIDENAKNVIESVIGKAEVTIGDSKTREYEVNNHGKSATARNAFFIDSDGSTTANKLIRALRDIGDGDVGYNQDTALLNDYRYREDSITSVTNIARYSNWDEDAKTISLYWAEAGTSDVFKRGIVELDGRWNGTAKNDRVYYIVDEHDTPCDTHYVTATKDTEFYFVYVEQVTGTWYAKSVTYGVGYSAMPAIGAADIYASYALATETRRDSSDKEYGVADVIVIEYLDKNLFDDYEETIFGYSNEARSNGRVQTISAVLNSTGELETINHSYTWFMNNFKIDFYDVDDLEGDNASFVSVGETDSGYNGHKIYAGTLDRVNSQGYWTVINSTEGASGNNNTVWLDLNGVEKEIPVYALYESDVRGTGYLGNTYVVEADEVSLSASKHRGDGIIWVRDSKGELVYAVLVDWRGNLEANGVDTTNKCPAQLGELFKDIIAEAAPAALAIGATGALGDNKLYVAIEAVPGRARTLAYMTVAQLQALNLTKNDIRVTMNGKNNPVTDIAYLANADVPADAKWAGKDWVAADCLVLTLTYDLVYTTNLKVTITSVGSDLKASTDVPISDDGGVGDDIVFNPVKVIYNPKTGSSATATKSSGGSVTSNSTDVPVGDTVTVTLTPAAGKRLADKTGWTLDTSAGTYSRDFEITGVDQELEMPEMTDINVIVKAPSGATVTASPTISTKAGGAELTSETITLTAASADGYSLVVDSVEVNGNERKTGYELTYTTGMTTEGSLVINMTGVYIESDITINVSLKSNSDLVDEAGDKADGESREEFQSYYEAAGITFKKDEDEKKITVTVDEKQFKSWLPSVKLDANNPMIGENGTTDYSNQLLVGVVIPAPKSAASARYKFGNGNDIGSATLVKRGAGKFIEDETEEGTYGLHFYLKVAERTAAGQDWTANLADDAYSVIYVMFYTDEAGSTGPMKTAADKWIVEIAITNPAS